MSSKSDDLIVVRIFNDRVTADLAKTALHAAGIECFVRSDDAGGLRPGMAFSNGVEVVVRAEDAQRANTILGAKRNG